MRIWLFGGSGIELGGLSYQSSSGGVRILECAPHFLANVGELLQVLVPILTQFVIHQAFRIFPFPVTVVLIATIPYNIGHDAEEGQFLVIAREALVLGVVQFPRAVIVQNVPEDVRVAIKEVLLGHLVVEELAFVAPCSG